MPSGAQPRDPSSETLTPCWFGVGRRTSGDTLVDILLVPRAIRVLRAVRKAVRLVCSNYLGQRRMQ